MPATAAPSALPAAAGTPTAGRPAPRPPGPRPPRRRSRRRPSHRARRTPAPAARSPAPPPRRRTVPPSRPASPPAPAPAGRSSPGRRRCRPDRRCAGRGWPAAAPPRPATRPSHCRRRTARAAPHVTAGRQRAQHDADHRQRGQRAAAQRLADCESAGPSRTRKPLRARRITDRRGRRRWPSRTSPSMPGWRSRPARRAARSRHRCLRRAASAGRRSVRVRAAPAPACAPVRWSGARPATTPARPGASRSATRAAAVTTTPSSSTGVRRTAAWARKPAIAARSAPPPTRSRPIGSDRTAVRPVQRVAHRRGLADPARVVDTGAAADHRHRLGVGQCRNQNRRRRGVSDAHVAGDQQVGAGVDLLVGDRRGPPRPRRTPRPRSARPRRRCHRCCGAPCGRRSPLTAGRRPPRCRRPAPSHRRCGQHVDRRAAGVDSWRPSARSPPAGRPRHPDRATPWSPANTTTRARSNCRGGQLPWHDATHTDRSSRRPSAPGGLVRVSCRARAAAAASASGAVTS